MSASRWCAALLLTASATTWADPGYYLVSVYENEGLRSVDFRYWTVKFDGSPVTAWPEIGLGYGVNKRWYTELYVSYIGDSNAATKFNTLNWQNDVLLTQGQYPFDLAIHSNLIAHRERSDGYVLELGPALQTDVGRTQINTNLFFERGFDADQAGQTRLKYQWQAKYRWKPYLHLGVQGFGEVGPWDDWAPKKRQSHRAGPALSGSLPTGSEQTIKYEAAYLFGKIYGSQGGMFSMRLQYLF